MTENFVPNPHNNSVVVPVDTLHNSYASIFFNSREPHHCLHKNSVSNNNHAFVTDFG